MKYSIQALLLFLIMSIATSQFQGMFNMVDKKNEENIYYLNSIDLAQHDLVDNKKYDNLKYNFYVISLYEQFKDNVYNYKIFHAINKSGRTPTIIEHIISTGNHLDEDISNFKVKSSKELSDISLSKKEVSSLIKSPITDDKIRTAINRYYFDKKKILDKYQIEKLYYHIVNESNLYYVEAKINDYEEQTESKYLLLLESDDKTIVVACELF